MRDAKLLVIVTMMILALICTLIGCAQPPEAEKSAAKTARNAAISAEAPRYAHADFEAAGKLWDNAEAQVRGKKYGEAKQGYIDARAAFEKATSAVAAGKKALVGEINIDELKAAVARLEEDWQKLQALAKKVEAKLEKKKLWEADSKTFTEGLKAAKDMIASDPISAKLKIDTISPFIDSYKKTFMQMAAAPEKSQKTRRETKAGEE